MDAESTETIDDGQTDGAPASELGGDGGAAVDVGFAEFAQGEVADQLKALEEKHGAAGESAPQTPPGGVEAPGAQPGAPDGQPGGPQAPVETPPSQTTAPSPMEALEQAIAAAGEALPAEVGQAIQSTMADFRAYEQELGSYAAQAEEKFAHAMNTFEQLDKIAGDPRFQKALQAVTGQSGHVPTNGNGNGNGAGGDPPPKPPELESDGERFLHERLGEVTKSLEELRSERAQDHAERQRERDAAHQRRVGESRGKIQTDLDSVHEALDAQFPQLSGDPRRMQEWENKALELAEAQLRAGGGLDVQRAFADAAKILTFDDQRSEGGKSALSAAKTAAGMATPSASGSQSATPRPATTMQGIFDEEKAARGM